MSYIKTIFLKVLLIFVIVIVIYNLFDENKINWNETKMESGLRMDFELFEGKKEIPLQLKSGQVIKINYSLHVQEGGIAITVLNPTGLPAEQITENSSSEISLKAKFSGKYKIIVHGNKLKNGEVKVFWEIY